MVVSRIGEVAKIKSENGPVCLTLMRFSLLPQESDSFGVFFRGQDAIEQGCEEGTS